MTLFERSPLVIAPSMFCFWTSITLRSASSTIVYLVLGMTMSSRPTERPERVANWKPSDLMRSSIPTVVSSPRFYCNQNLGLETTVGMLDRIKSLGFQFATRSGLSVGLDDMVIPKTKYTMVEEADRKVIEVQKQNMDGAITNGERSNKVIQMWSAVTDQVADEMFSNMKRADEEGAMNPIYIMADSGARGSKQQIRQLSGMRGLMAKPSGEVIETPITANFREGLTVLEYFISTHGARK